MTARNRVIWFGSAAALAVLGLIAGRVIGGVLGEAVMVALECIGAIAIVSLVFLEVGLSEDRERARETRPDGGRDRRPPRSPVRHRRRPGGVWNHRRDH